MCENEASCGRVAEVGREEEMSTDGWIDTPATSEERCAMTIDTKHIATDKWQQFTLN